MRTERDERDRFVRVEGDLAVLVDVEALEVSRLAPRLAIAGQHAVAGRGRPGKQLILAELPVVVGVESLETGLLARLPFGAVDGAVLIGVVAHDAGRSAVRLVGRGGQGLAVGSGEGRGGEDQESGREREKLRHRPCPFGCIRKWNYSFHCPYPAV